MPELQVDLKKQDPTPKRSKSGLDFARVGPIFALVFVDVLGLTVILPLLHLYAATYGASALEVGLVAAAFPLAQLVGVPMMGALSDRFGRKPLLLISQVTTCLSFILLGLANSLLLVILSRVLDGLFGANLATAQAALSDVTDEENRAAGLGLTGAAFGLGFIFGPVTSIIALELGGSLAIPAFTAAVYSFISILLTLFIFKETLPPERRGQAQQTRFNPWVMRRVMRLPGVTVLLVVMFVQQLIFFGFESLLGLFLLSRLGLLGQASALVFLWVGLILIVVQGRYIGIWTRRYGERKLVYASIGLLTVGLLALAFTPAQPHPFYVQRGVEFELAQQTPGTTEALTGINVALPAEGNNGLGGVIWTLVAIIPLSIGSGLIRPSLNSLMTRRASAADYGAVLGVSASFVSAANAIAPLLGGLVFQQYGVNAPFLGGGLLMALVLLLSVRLIRPGPGETVSETGRAQAQPT